MAEDTCLVRWAGRQAVVTFPERIDVSNAGQITEELLALINRGAALLVADLTATMSCDYAGAEALARAHRRAAASGTQMRLVVTAPIVRRVLAVNGLDRLISFYPDLEAAAAGGAGRAEAQGQPRTVAAAPAVPMAGELPPAASRAWELLDQVMTSIFDVGMVLQAAVDPPREPAEVRITEALRRLDDVIRDVRDAKFAERAQKAQPGLAGGSPLEGQQSGTLAADRAAALQERMAQAARALQLTAASAAALLERQAGLTPKPARIDFPTEIKRWRAFADQAEQMAKRWQQQPQLPGSPGTPRCF